MLPMDAEINITEERTSVKPVYYHVLPLSKVCMLCFWLAALKHHDPPVGPGQKLCSDPFNRFNYQKREGFQCAKFVCCTANKLRAKHNSSLCCTIETTQVLQNVSISIS